MTGDIRSETKFLWEFILGIIKFPFLLIARKNDPFKPFKDLGKFIFEAKFTISMIVINCLVFVWEIFAGEDKIMFFVQTPTDLFSAKIYTIFTAGFLHADGSHIFWNMLAVFAFGRVVERKLGPLKTAGVYFGALIISGLFSALINLFLLGDNTPGLGASGALMGLVAAAILVNPFYISWSSIIPLPVMVLGWLAIAGDITGVLNPTADGIGHLAHIGGFISVFVTLYLLKIEDRGELKKGLIINIVSITVIGAAWFGLKYFGVLT